MPVGNLVRNVAAGATLAFVVGAAATGIASAAPPAKDTQLMTVYAVSCPSWGLVPANESPLDWDETGHGSQLNTAADVALADESDIPAGCDAGKNFTFSVTGREARGMTVNRSATFALSERELEVAATDGLWVSAQPPSGMAFAGLRCYDDVKYGDSLEHMVVPRDVQPICIAYGVPGEAQQEITLLAVTCKSFADVPGNDLPKDWDETGHGGELATGASNDTTDPSDIPANCDKGENFVFTLTGAADNSQVATEKVSSRNGQTITLEGRAFESLSNGGIFVRVAPKAGYAFAGLRCHDDVIFSDNLELIYVTKAELPHKAIYCIGFGVKQ